MEKIKVSIVDDHPMVISGLKYMLEPFHHIRIISSYPSGEALLEGLKSLQPDVLLLDILMPEMQGPEIARLVTKFYPRINILAITSLNAPTHLKSMMKSGCKGYLLKNTDQKVLVEALEAVHKGEEFIEPILKEQIFENMFKYKKQQRALRPTEMAVLTRREKEILQLIVQEYSNQEIADRLYISLRTVENHRFNLHQKLEVKNTIGLMKIAIQMGLV